MAVRKNPKEIRTGDPFVSLFPIDPLVLANVTANMRDRGYDTERPLTAWRDAYGRGGEHVLVDGHTRLKAAITAGITEVPVVMRRFDDEDAALQFAIGEQAHRRNLTSAQLAVYVLGSLDRLGDGARGKGARNDLYGRSRKQLADMLGVGEATISRARKLIDSGDQALLAAVKDGTVSLKAAVSDLDERGPDGKPWPTPEPAPPAPTEKELEEARARVPSPRDATAIVDALAAAQPMPGHMDVDDVMADPAVDEPEPAGGYSKIAYALWEAVEEIRAFEDHPMKDAQAVRFMLLVCELLDYFGIDPSDEDATVQESIFAAAWDGNETSPAPWKVTS